MAKKEILNNDAVTVRVGETVTDILDEAADVVEQTLDLMESIPEKIVTVTKNNPFVMAGVFILGASIGGFAAYKITQKRLTDQFEDELTEQISAAKQYHSRLAKEGDYESPESAVKALVPEEVVNAVQSYQGREKIAYDKPETIVDPRPPVEVVVEEVQVTKNVFVDGREPDPRDWDYNAELADRELHPDIPYTISFDEFNENPEHNEQRTLTYYAMDDQLVDERDQPIDSTEATVGDDNLNRFGDGSGDPNVVYVRNEKISMDFEIIRDKGSYSKAVFGSDSEQSLQHSRRRPNRRTWRADE